MAAAAGLLISLASASGAGAQAPGKGILDGTWQLQGRAAPTLAAAGQPQTCVPPGVPLIMASPEPFEILSSPGQVSLVFEQDHNQRWVRLDIPHSSDPDPDYMGEAVGRWEGKTLVADTIGFNDRTPLDAAGARHSEQLHIVERLSLLDRNHLQDLMTIEDKGSFKGARTVRHVYVRLRGRRFAEEVCEERGVQLPDTLKVHPQ